MSNYPIIPASEAAPAPGEPLQGEVLFGPPPATREQSMLALLDMTSYVMDRLFEVPGTKIRFGLNTLLLILPIVGDAFTSFVSAAILMIGLNNFRVPRIVAARMVMNSLIDAVIGWIPILGDLFNLWFKADTRNVRLLMEHAGRGEGDRPSTRKHWFFVIGVGLAFAVFLALMIVGVWWLIALAVQAFHAAPASAP